MKRSATRPFQRFASASARAALSLSFSATLLRKITRAADGLVMYRTCDAVWPSFAFRPAFSVFSEYDRVLCRKEKRAIFWILRIK